MGIIINLLVWNVLTLVAFYTSKKYGSETSEDVMFWGCLVIMNIWLSKLY